MVIKNFPRTFVAMLITVYQWSLSPDHGLVSLYNIGVCKFVPTCSEHTKHFVMEHGVAKGFYKGLQQIKQCHS